MLTSWLVGTPGALQATLPSWRRLPQGHFSPRCGSSNSGIRSPTEGLHIRPPLKVGHEGYCHWGRWQDPTTQLPPTATEKKKIIPQDDAWKRRRTTTPTHNFCALCFPRISMVQIRWDAHSFVPCAPPYYTKGRVSVGATSHT